MKRILYVHNSADLYGASRSLLRLVSRIIERGYEPLVVLPQAGPLKSRLEELGVELVVEQGLAIIDRANFKPIGLVRLALRFPGSVLRLRRLIRDRRIDLVHTNTGVIVSAALAAWLAHVPHIWHIRDWFQEFGWLWKWYSRYILVFSRRVIAVSQAIASQFPSTPKVVVINNGLELPESSTDFSATAKVFRQSYDLDGSLVVGCVGRIKFGRKGQEVFLEAARLLKQRGLRARYVIVGSPAAGNEEQLSRLKGLIVDLRLEDDVVLTGELEDVRPAYSAMDILVLPSAQPEPFGGVVLEAMAMKLPVIATAVGGSVEQVQDGSTGFLVPPANPEALAQRLELLLGDAPLRLAMGLAGYDRLIRCFSIGRMLDQLEQIYDDCAPTR